MAKEKEITLKIVSAEGHTEFQGTGAEALAELQEQCTNNSKWAYVDGRQVNPDTVGIEDLLNAEDITLANTLIGG
ncbi:hypothetical protein HN682_04330 [Candidatus Peregrinibacteria bacterium]|jgi:hypothetical protein|nr:hypothetical protein [Candidatus Peregrinibacteria bacterium]